MVKAFPDYMAQEEAAKLAAKIQRHWNDLGHAGVRAWTVKSTVKLDKLDKGRRCFSVRSNLVGGMPQP